ncbi:MAG: hypothetical protein EOP83_01720 [Verrucomicrobiaceae bacterium]|nr:MAG: hypothetical protein EOP83_01720 [Verrucomicrobiaceae bacterium]
MKDSYLSSMTDSMVTAKAAKVFCENGWGLSIVTACYDDSRFAFLHGDPRRPDYETMVLPPVQSQGNGEREDEVTYDVALREVEDQIRSLSARPFASTVDLEPYNFPLFELPSALHNPTIHGSFLYQDVHNLNSELWSNRILLDPARWLTIQRESIPDEHGAGRYAGVISVNRWCSENCIAGYAWTGSSPTWVFERREDAVAFKIRWG